MDTNQKYEIFRNLHRNRNMTQEVQPRRIYLQQKRVMRGSASWLLSIFQLVFGRWGFWVWSNTTISICRLVDLSLPPSSKPVSLSPPMVKLTFSISGTWKQIFRWSNRVQLLNSTVKELPQNLFTNTKLASRAITVRTPNFTTDLLLPEARSYWQISLWEELTLITEANTGARCFCLLTLNPTSFTSLYGQPDPPNIRYTSHWTGSNITNW